jgi:hypothetical protein
MMNDLLSTITYSVECLTISLTTIKKPLLEWLQSVESKSGRYWTRTSDPCRVKTVLYQLS